MNIENKQYCLLSIIDFKYPHVIPVFEQENNNCKITHATQIQVIFDSKDPFFIKKKRSMTLNFK